VRHNAGKANPLLAGGISSIGVVALVISEPGLKRLTPVFAEVLHAQLTCVVLRHGQRQR
jgi:hypothetical protein